MKPEAELQFCQVCVNQKKDLSLGIMCNLNGDIADFEDSCDTFQRETSLTVRTSWSLWSKNIDAPMLHHEVSDL